MVRFDIRDANFSPYMLDSIIKLLIWDSDILTKLYYTVETSVFDGERKIMVDLCYKHFENYKDVPGEYISDIVQDYISRHPTKKLLDKYLQKLQDINPNREYVMNTFGGVIQDVICQNSFAKAKQYMDRGERERAQEELVNGFKRAGAISGKAVLDLLEESGTNMVSEDIMEPNFKTFIDPYDKITGGFHKPEAVLLFGAFNVGKTWLLNYLGKVAIIQGKKVLHITLETSYNEVKARYASAITASKVKVNQDAENFHGEIYNPRKYDKSAEFLRSRGGKLWVVQGLSFSFNDLVALFNNIELTTDSVPDVLILDSPDQMDTGNRYRDEIANEKRLYRQILDFTKERNLTTIVTTQAQRQTSENQFMKGFNVGGSIAKAQIFDTGWILNQGKTDYENQVGMLYVFRHRGAKKYTTIEIKQDLDIGQPVLSARLVRSGKQEAIKEASALGLKFEEEKGKES